jgi:hypothetical protein
MPLRQEDFTRLSREGLVDVYQNVMETFVWFTKRHLEFALFRYLQGSADRLSSMSANELKHAVDELLLFLEFGHQNAELDEEQILAVSRPS